MIPSLCNQQTEIQRSAVPLLRHLSEDKQLDLVGSSHVCTCSMPRKACGVADFQINFYPN